MENPEARKRITLPPDHPLREEFLKTDQTVDAYLTLACDFLQRMPCDNAPAPRR
jgi:hypothetical protein